MGEDSKKLEHGCRMTYDGCPVSFGLGLEGLEDGHVPTFWLLLLLSRLQANLLVTYFFLAAARLARCFRLGRCSMRLFNNPLCIMRTQSGAVRYRSGTWQILSEECRVVGYAETALHLQSIKVVAPQRQSLLFWLFKGHLKVSSGTV